MFCAWLIGGAHDRTLLKDLPVVKSGIQIEMALRTNLI